jgi:hypothetical protein
MVNLKRILEIQSIIDGKGRINSNLEWTNGYKIDAKFD